VQSVPPVAVTVAECADDGQQAGLDSPVHLRDSCLPGCVGLADQLAGGLQLAAVLGQELSGPTSLDAAFQAAPAIYRERLQLGAVRVVDEPSGPVALSPAG
jgi:hypothetical protein